MSINGAGARGKACRVCAHPKRAEIDAKIIAGVSYRQLEQDYPPLSDTALFRHGKAHIERPAADTSRAADLLDRVDDIVDRIEKLLNKAEKAGDVRGALAATRELSRCVEMAAKLRGAIATAPQVSIVAAPDFQGLLDIIREFVIPERMGEMALRVAALSGAPMLEGRVEDG